MRREHKIDNFGKKSGLSRKLATKRKRSGKRKLKFWSESGGHKGRKGDYREKRKHLSSGSGLRTRITKERGKKDGNAVLYANIHKNSKRIGKKT